VALLNTAFVATKGTHEGTHEGKHTPVQLERGGCKRLGRKAPESA